MSSSTYFGSNETAPVDWEDKADYWYATEYRTAGIIVGVLFVVVALVFGIVGVTVGRRRKCNWLLGCVFFALAGIIEAIGLWYRSTLKEGSSGCYDSCATYPQFFVWWLLLIPALAFLITGTVLWCRTETDRAPEEVDFQPIAETGETGHDETNRSPAEMVPTVGVVVPPETKPMDVV